MKKILQIALLLLLTSCYTLKKAQKQVIKAHLNYPEVSSFFCSKTFPVKDSIVEKIKFTKGNDIVKIDTITVDCDEIVKDNTKSNKVAVQYKNIYRTDTIYRNKIIVKENTAKTENLQLQIVAKGKVIIKKDAEIEELEGKIRVLAYFLIAAIIAIIFILKFKR